METKRYKTKRVKRPNWTGLVTVLLAFMAIAIFVIGAYPTAAPRGGAYAAPSGATAPGAASSAGCPEDPTPISIPQPDMADDTQTVTPAANGESEESDTSNMPETETADGVTEGESEAESETTEESSEDEQIQLPEGATVYGRGRKVIETDAIASEDEIMATSEALGEPIVETPKENFIPSFTDEDIWLVCQVVVCEVGVFKTVLSHDEAMEGFRLTAEALLNRYHHDYGTTTLHDIVFTGKGYAQKTRDRINAKECDYLIDDELIAIVRDIFVNGSESPDNMVFQANFVQGTVYKIIECPGCKPEYYGLTPWYT